MKYLFIIFLLCSCSPQFHLDKAAKHASKALDKGAVLTTSNDTLYINDTIVTTQTLTQNDTVFITEIRTVEKIINQVGEIRYITRKDKRKEVKQIKVDSKRAFKLDKLDRRIEKVKTRKENKSFGKWFILLKLVGIIIIYLLWKKLNR